MRETADPTLVSQSQINLAQQRTPVGTTSRSPHSHPDLGAVVPHSHARQPARAWGARLGCALTAAAATTRGAGGGGGSRASVWLHPEAPGELPADLALAPPPQHSHLSLPPETVGLGRRASVCGHVLTELEKQQAGQDPAVLEKGDSGFPPITAGEASPGRTEAQGRFPESHVCRRPRPPAAVHVLCSSGPAEGTAPGEAGRRAEGEQARGLAEEDPLAANHKTRAFKQNSELRQRDTRHWTWKLLSV